MAKDYSISIYLDTRRAKSNGKFPVKLRVYKSKPTVTKYYPTLFDLSKEEFKSIWETTKPRNEWKDLKRKLLSVQEKAEIVAEKLFPFSFDQFEKRLYRKSGDGMKIAYHYGQKINELINRNQIGTASSYQLAEKSIVNFLDSKSKYQSLTFFDITAEWLKNYESYMTDNKGLSLTTVGIYLRTLRALFNKSIDDKELEKDYYPFGRNRYKIPASKNVKKALNKHQLKLLFDSTPQTNEQEKAKHLWFFSYACNGMNIKDIVLLKYKDIENDRIQFYRAKTKVTSKENLKPIIVYLNDYTKGVIEKYGSQSKSANNLIFNIVSENDNATEIHRKIKNFTRYINQHIKKLCISIDFPLNVTVYTARHSFASNFVQSGATLVDAMESLGHSNIQTTQNYLRSFDDDSKKELSNSLMNFE